MTAQVDPYCAIYGYDFSSIARSGGVSSSSGSIKTEEIVVPGRDYADVREAGRQIKKYKIVVISTDRAEIETFLNEVNYAPVDAEFYPFDATRKGTIESAHAVLKTVADASGRVFYEATAEITCREAWLVGPDQGIEMAWAEPLNVVSALLTNSGQERAPISYLQISVDANLPYIENLSVRITPSISSAEHDRELVLCTKMLRRGTIELGWRGECLYSWEADLSQSMAVLSRDVHGNTAGGYIAGGVLTLENRDYILLQFYGPLQVDNSDEAVYIDLAVNAITGDGAASCVAFSEDLSDIHCIAGDVVIGRNRLYFEGLERGGFFAIGIRAAAIGSISISEMKMHIMQHVPPSQVPYSEPGESFKIRVEATAGERLRFVQAFQNNRYWY